ncbi:MAG: DUF6115 domain-containing protein [Clostridium sp.]|nr:DUF6115 domain-containing protein [Clostridium sp.]MCM1397977.1 DUF6115 domain-containing protein [Clostridium sp.]MCM1459387.1 DUF6115 domain-containing protein [Bacteroides sp.]
MSTPVVVLIIIGIIFIFVSYIFSETLEQSMQTEEGPIEIPDELSDEQKEKISNMINDYMAASVDGRLNEIEEKLSEIVNQKTLALGDYAVTVNEEISRNHNEVMFLYSMLSDKQKEIMSTATVVDEYRKEVEEFVSRNNIAVEPNSNEAGLESEIKEVEEDILDNAEAETITPEVDSSKDVILEMHKSGLSILEIAKHLGLGVGEVKLVVDLYQGEAK